MGDIFAYNSNFGKKVSRLYNFPSCIYYSQTPDFDSVSTDRIHIFINSCMTPARWNTSLVMKISIFLWALLGIKTMWFLFKWFGQANTHRKSPLREIKRENGFSLRRKDTGGKRNEGRSRQTPEGSNNQLFVAVALVTRRANARGWFINLISPAMPIYLEPEFTGSKLCRLFRPVWKQQGISCVKAEQAFKKMRPSDRPRTLGSL